MSWIIDKDNPSKTRARILAIVLSLLPLLMAGYLMWLAP